MATVLFTRTSGDSLSDNASVGSNLSGKEAAFLIPISGLPDTAGTIVIPMRTNAGGTGTVRVSLMSSTGTVPNVDLATSTNVVDISTLPHSGSTLSLATYSNQTFTFSGESLTGNPNIWVVIYASADVSGAVLFPVDDSGGGHFYLGAEGTLGDHSTVSWTIDGGADREIVATLSSPAGNPTTIDGSNNTVTGSATWGTGTSITVTANGSVQSGGALTLDIPDLDSFTGDGYYVEVAPGGSLSLGGETVVVVDGKTYRLLSRS